MFISHICGEANPLIVARATIVVNVYLARWHYAVHEREEGLMTFEIWNMGLVQSLRQWNQNFQNRGDLLVALDLLLDMKYFVRYPTARWYPDLANYHSFFFTFGLTCALEQHRVLAFYPVESILGYAPEPQVIAVRQEEQEDEG